MHLVAELCELLVNRLNLARGGRGGSSTALERGGLALLESLSLDSTLGLQLVNSLAVLPADLARDALERRVLATRLEAQHTEGVWDDQLLLAVVRRGDTLVDLQALERSSTTGRLVGHHTANSTEEDARGGAVVERTRLAGVHQVALVHESMVLQLNGERNKHTLLRKKLPDTLISSARTTVTF